MPSWVLLGLVAAAGAALVAIFGKVGLRDADPIAATAARATIMAAVTIGAAAVTGKLGTLATLGQSWIWVVAAGVAGAVSWLAYFTALQTGQASAVSALDRLSIVFVVLLAALPIVGEELTVAKVAGSLLVVAGVYLIAR